MSPSQDAVDDAATQVANDASDPGANVGRLERIASVGVGTALVVRGASSRSLGGVATALVGVGLVVRGVRGTSRLYRRLGVDTASTPDRAGSEERAVTVERSITVGERAEDLEAYWRDPDQLTRIVGPVADVSGSTRNEGGHRWELAGPFDRTLEWETRLVDERPGERLRWETLDGATIPHDWTVLFDRAPDDRGTEVTVRIGYDPPGGSMGDATLSKLGPGVDALVGQALRRFKRLAETGTVPSLEANPSGRGKGDVL
ncbi:SRPBCC family protein [Halopiger goleimassiliensis]|uniref:SRPBCC family protein n=1 Tax=Halopiger goleimassiliensis TaxID=1293048 RepID=UPI00067792A1|nr:SRPBCC family protein [Halopiger goleimassiliensis]